MQLILTQCAGFKKKVIQSKESNKKNVKSKYVPPVLPARLEGKIKQCEECGTIQNVEIFEKMYLCKSCYDKLSSPQEPIVIVEYYPVRYICKKCGGKAVMYDENEFFYCKIHALEILKKVSL